MTHPFNDISYSIEDGQLVLLLSNDEEIVVEAKVSKDRLIGMYPDEFAEQKYVLNQWDSPPEWIPTGDYISLRDWATEYLNEARAWKIFEELEVDSLVLIEG